MPKCERQRQLVLGCCAFLAQGTSLGRHKAPGREPACEPAATILECRPSVSTSCDPAWPGVARHATGICDGSGDMVAECLARTVSSWYMPGVRRKDAERLLAGRNAGAFVLRTTAGGSYCLSFAAAASAYRLRRSFRTETKGPTPTKVVHQIVLRCPAGGTYGLQGSSLRFDTITNLVAFYCIQRDILPGVLVLPPAARDIAFSEVAAGREGAVRLNGADHSSGSSRKSWPDAKNTEPSSTTFGLNCSTTAELPDGRRAITAAMSTSLQPSPADEICPRDVREVGTCGSRSGSSVSDRMESGRCEGDQCRQASEKIIARQLPPVEPLRAPPAPPLRRRRCAAAPQTLATKTSVAVPLSVDTGCELGRPAEATVPPAAESAGTQGVSLPLPLPPPPSVTSMATVYTTTAVLQKPMQLTYDASSDLVCMSSSDDGIGVFSAGPVEISTKAVICIGDAEPSASAESSRKTCRSRDDGRGSGGGRWAESRSPDGQPLPRSLPAPLARQIGMSRHAHGSNTTADNGAVYHAGTLDDRLSDYEDIWSSSSSSPPSDADRLSQSEQQGLLQSPPPPLPERHGGSHRDEDGRRQHSQSRSSRKKDSTVPQRCEGSLSSRRSTPLAGLQSERGASSLATAEPDALRGDSLLQAGTAVGFRDSRSFWVPGLLNDSSSGCALNLSDHFLLLGDRRTSRNATGDFSSRGFCPVSCSQTDALESVPSISAPGGGLSSRRLATPGLHRRVTQQQQHSTVTAAGSSAAKVSPIRCDIIRPAGAHSSSNAIGPPTQDVLAVLSADAPSFSASAAPLLLPVLQPAPYVTAVEDVLRDLPIASVAPAPTVVSGGAASLRLRLLANDGSDGSDRDSGAIDYDCEEETVHCSAAVLADSDRALRCKLGAGVIRTTSLREKATASVSIQLPLKPQTLPVHLLRKPDADDVSSEGAAAASADFESDEVGRSRRRRYRDGGRTPSEIADDMVAEVTAAAAATGDESIGRRGGTQPLLTSSRCPKFPLSLRLSSGSGAGEDLERTVLGTDSATAAAPRQPLERPSRLLELIETALPDCVLPAICPLTLTNLQRLSTYDNVSPLSQRSGNRLSSGSSSTVFSKPWDASRIEELFYQNARVRSRINTSVLSETSEDCELGGTGDGGGCCAAPDAQLRHRRIGQLPTSAEGGWLEETAHETIAETAADVVRRTLPSGRVEAGFAAAAASVPPSEMRSPSSDVPSLSPVSLEQPIQRSQQQLQQQQHYFKGTVAMRPHHGQAVAQHSCPASDSIRASKYRRSVDFNRDVISARWNSDSSKDPRAEDDGDSGTELEGASQGGAIAVPTQKKPERSAAVFRKGSDTAKGDIVYNDSHASLQSFSEQIKLMRSPSSTGAGTSSTPATQLPAVTIQERVCQLARDKKTTFGSTVDNFIQCTAESTEPNPHVILRNIRQFMSGMKNYLTQQGEGSFSDLLQSVQRQLPPNEFVNIDTVLEAALIRCVVFPLKAVVDKAFVALYTRNGSLKELADGIKIARSKSAIELGMKVGLEPPQGQSLETIKLWLVKMQSATSPVRKLENLLCACSAIFAGMRVTGEPGAVSSLAAEDFLVVMTYVVAHCGLITAEIEADYTRGLLQSSLSSGEGGYYLNVLSSSVAVIKRLGRSRPFGVSGGQPLRLDATAANSCLASCLEKGAVHAHTNGASSIAAAAGGCATGSVRIHVPNESTGSILTRTIPVRPSMTAREIRSMVAHKLFITNPQDYGLYVVVGGVEHRLLDTDTVDDVVGSAVACAAPTGDTVPGECAARGAVVFKRMSAHIVWPSVMS